MIGRIGKSVREKNKDSKRRIGTNRAREEKKKKKGRKR